MSEHDEQVSYFDWVNLMINRDKRYKNIYAVPNGGLRNLKVAVKLKKEGVRSGVFDCAIDWPSNDYHGLRIEMKYNKNKLTDNQKKWAKQYEEAGYKTSVCYSWEEAKEITEQYFRGEL